MIHPCMSWALPVLCPYGSLRAVNTASPHRYTSQGFDVPFTRRHAWLSVLDGSTRFSGKFHIRHTHWIFSCCEDVIT